MEELSEGECLELLAEHHFGRIGVISGGRPLIFPVNYVFASGRVAIRTDPGTKLASATLDHVAFEIDEADPASRSGWSVLLQGVAHDATDALDLGSEALRTFPVEPWAPGAKASWIRIDPHSITGRRIGRRAPGHLPDVGA